LFGAHYKFGKDFVELLTVTKQFNYTSTVLPTSEENIFDPVSYFNNDKPIKVQMPKKIPRNARMVFLSKLKSQDYTIRAFMWYIILATYTSQNEALQSTIGWRGDTMRVYELDGRICVILRYVGDTTTDVNEMESTLGKLASALNKNDPILIRTGYQIDLRLCDPGPDTKIPDVEKIFSAPILRYKLIIQMMKNNKVDVHTVAYVVDKKMTMFNDTTIKHILANSDSVMHSILIDLEHSLK
jgi:hypothetical protein